MAALVDRLLGSCSVIYWLQESAVPLAHCATIVCDVVAM